ncbi:MAG: DUF4974 domain-containing protein [Duncaniella sp.]|nr:DUF4974 domain-containing protein [Muribaculum sp.]MCM1254595.1 DUF4974 domain-containing protein [Duncaniella sp.]
MDKIDKLLDALEHPEHYPDSEIQEMLHDPEVKEVYKLLGRTKTSLQPIAVPDVDAEWDAFVESRQQPVAKPRFRILSFFSRNVAASVIIGIASLAAVAAIVGVSVSSNFVTKEEAMTSDTIASQSVHIMAIDTIYEMGGDEIAAQEIVIFDNEPLQTIVAAIARNYGYKPVFASEDAKSLRLYFRWDKNLPVEQVVESLNNFEQIHIILKGKTITID